MMDRLYVYGDGVLATTVRDCLSEQHSHVFADDHRHATELLVCADTAIGEDGRGQTDELRRELDALRPDIPGGALVVIMSQVKVGFTRSVESAWRNDDPSLTFAYVPENVRVAHARDDFRQQDRIVAGLGEGTDPARVARIFSPFTARMLTMSLESAELSKHALNSYLGLMIAWTNELARIAEVVGADPSDIELALRSEARVSAVAPIKAGAPFGLGHIERDLHYLLDIADEMELRDDPPILRAILPSNAAAWGR